MEINLINLTKSFPGDKKKGTQDTVAVNHVNLTIPSGELFGLLGPSGWRIRRLRRSFRMWQIDDALPYIRAKGID